MTKVWNCLTRRLAPLAGAGLLLQANGCTLDTTNLAQDLITAFGNDLISSYVFGAFNLTAQFPF